MIDTYTEVAIKTLMLVYYVYFLRIIRLKIKKIKISQPGEGKTDFVKAIEAALKVTTVVVPIVECISIVADWSRMPGAAKMAGFLAAGLGAMVFCIAAFTMEYNWWTIKKCKANLVTDGIYKYSRNPEILGIDMVRLGILLMYFNWLLFAVTLLDALLQHLHIVNVEEDYLKDAYKDEYLEYCRHVNRYLGRKCNEG